MTEKSSLSSRKSDHIQINLNEDVRSGLPNGLEVYRFIHQALPEINLGEVDMSLRVFGRELRAPLLISSMTGGTEEAGLINRHLAEAAQASGVAMGLGSQRVAIEHPALAHTFQVRKFAPHILLLANIGAIQLNYGYATEHCRRAVEMVEADALILHLNCLQEALQPDGEGNFTGLLAKIEQVCREVGVPVIAKEVGWGISGSAARQLASTGVAAIDVAGAGGTSWSQVEMYRNPDEHLARVAGAFLEWGIPTAESICQAREAAPDVMIFASGGLRDGVEIAKCLALGATMGGMAGPFLKQAVQSSEAVFKTIQEVLRQLQVSMFAAGATNIEALQHTPLVKRG